MEQTFAAWNLQAQEGIPWIAAIRLQDAGAFYNLDTARIINLTYCLQNADGMELWMQTGPLILRQLEGTWRFDERNSLLELFLEPELCSF